LRNPILFISTMAGSPFGGSEVLWTRTAALLAKQGVPVAASVHGWEQLDRRISELLRVGVDLRPRPLKSSLVSLARRYMSGKEKIVVDIESSFGNILPSLVVISNGFVVPPIELAEMCVAKHWPYATVAHVNLAAFWPHDELAGRFRKVLPLARRCFFVSESNKLLAGRQFDYNFDNAEVIHNPTNVETASPIPWPSDVSEKQLRMACVGRLASEKGLDVLFEVLANSCWRTRNWRLSLYGEGPIRDVLGRLVNRLGGLHDRVSFEGHVAAVEKIWRENHVLVMPSRHEGMPLAIFEAMWCGRPVVAANVGGVSEVIKDDLTGFVAEAAVAESFGRALERMWRQRDRLPEIGKLAAANIREIMPDDPVGIFAAKLRSLAAV
jgi:glycosyltransferase involved in cell wall biosynthesis